ncbi:MAG TPA: glycosyltransferase [Terriglobia bacterium]|nr:glycosyltransferase [Terriglobia bacterium]
MALLYFICGVALIQGVVSLVQGVRSVRHIRTYRPNLSATNWRPRVVVFCPCRGVDPGFRDNVLSILNQDYPAFRVVFIVDSESDPAMAALNELHATALIAGPASDRGQKVHNLIAGVEHAAGDAEVLVFCDSDARFSREWLQRLIAPLEAESVAVSTGYRWYAAEGGSLPALLRSAWNASVVTALGDHGRNFAWGGSMALRRDVFEKIGVRREWEGALSDDYAVTRAAHRSGKRIVFVPQCLIPSYGECTWRELLEFTTRQILIARVYDPAIWRMTLVSTSVFNIAFWGGLFLPWPYGMVTPLLYLLAGIKSLIRYNAVATVLPHGALSKHRASYILLAPLNALLFEYNLFRSALTRTITWRQIRYKLISPNRTEVYRGVAES